MKDNETLELFPAFTRARRTDPPTSRVAAESVSHKLRESQEAVLYILRRFGPQTDEKIADLYGTFEFLTPKQSPSGLRTRRHELVALGKVRDSGKRERLKSGRWSIIWEVTS